MYKYLKMALFKKKKDVRELKLPELPSSLAFPELPREDERELPSLPQMRPMPQLPQLSALPQMPSIAEKETPLFKPMTMEIGEGMKMREGPVFVKIDKFKDAMANFEIVKKKLQESSVLLEKIRETRAKEEAELNEWAGELNTLKEKISQIDRKIFSSLD